MKTQICGYFCIYDRNSQKLIGIDAASGGYPFATSDFRSVHLFFTKESAQEYADKFKKGDSYNFDFVVKPVAIQIGGL